jgi:hypothetical protein
MVTLKTKFSLTVYGNNEKEIETKALADLASYLDTDVDTVRSSLDIEILVQTTEVDDKNTDKPFKATVYASIKRASMNFANNT